jgi:chaperonin GroEL (HSP60 family)
MESKENHILIVRAITDGKTRYMTAKKLTQLFGEVSFSEWKAKLDSGAGTVVMRAENEDELEPVKRSIEMLGAQVDVVDQKDIGGAKLF